MRKLKYILPSILVLIYLVLPLTALANQNTTEYFSDFPWGADFETVRSEMVYGGEEDLNIAKNCKFYTKNNEDLSMGRVQLKSIHYYFWHDKFAGVIIAPVAGGDNWLEIKNTLFEVLGEKPESNYYSYWWSGNITITTLFKANSYKGEQLRIMSKKVIDEADLWQTEQVRNRR